MEGRMGECCAGPPPFCEVLIHTKRGNRAIRRTRPEALFPPSKASGQFSAGYPSKEAAWPQPANFAEYLECELRQNGVLGSSLAGSGYPQSSSTSERREEV